ncbi:MAG: hypothetical protein V4477_20340 [Pseudomonadota bacterium]
MAKESFKQTLDRAARGEEAGKIRRLKLRLQEVQKLDPNKANSPELQSLEVGILHCLADAFGQSTAAFRQFSAAGDFGVEHDSHMIDVGVVRNAKQRAVALLGRAIQTKEEEFDDRFQTEATLAPPPSVGIGMASPTVLGSGITGVAGGGVAGTMGATSIGEFELDATAEVKTTSVQAYDLLLARVAVLEATLAAPKAPLVVPIGLGHNGPPDFEPPISEEEIKGLVELFRSQAAAAVPDLPKLLEITKTTEVRAGQLRRRMDDFSDAAVKGAGGEFGKKLVQLPWWMAVYAALNGVLEAATAWMTSFPMQ